jgi:DivIVA domain-containing protein
MPDQINESRYPNLALIDAKKFRLGLKGYNVNEVDEFLSALAVEIGALRSALDTAESEVARLRAQAAT